MKHLILIPILSMLAGCVSLRIPQLPPVDAAINASTDPINKQRWLLTYNDQKYIFVPQKTERGIEFIGFGGQLIWFDGERVSQMYRLGQSPFVHSWKRLEIKGDKRSYQVYEGLKRLYIETCIVQEHIASHLKEKCSASGYSRIKSERVVMFDQAGWPRKLTWMHPATGWEITLDRQADEN